jgi:uncharacterized protein with von Willebrand factor type A (vWA) domain
MQTLELAQGHDDRLATLVHDLGRATHEAWQAQVSTKHRHAVWMLRYTPMCNRVAWIGAFG